MISTHELYYRETLKDHFLQSLHSRSFCKKCFETYGDKLLTWKERSRETANPAFASMRVNPKAIMVALDLYFKGISLRKIQDHLRQFEQTHVSFVAVYKWIQKYVALMEQYAKLLRPQLSGV